MNTGVLLQSTPSDDNLIVNLRVSGPCNAEAAFARTPVGTALRSDQRKRSARDSDRCRPFVASTASSMRGRRSTRLMLLPIPIGAVTMTSASGSSASMRPSARSICS